MVKIYPQLEALIKSKIDEYRLSKMLRDVDKFAEAAEQMAKKNGLDGVWKNNLVIELLRDNGYDITETLKAYVEAKVLRINQNNAD